MDYRVGIESVEAALPRINELSCSARQRQTCGADGSSIECPSCRHRKTDSTISQHCSRKFYVLSLKSARVPLYLLCRDSMSQDLFRALKCFMLEFHDLKLYQASTNYVAMFHLDNIAGHGRPECLHLLGNARVCYVSSLSS